MRREEVTYAVSDCEQVPVVEERISSGGVKEER